MNSDKLEEDFQVYQSPLFTSGKMKETEQEKNGRLNLLTHYIIQYI